MVPIWIGVTSLEMTQTTNKIPLLHPLLVVLVRVVLVLVENQVLAVARTQQFQNLHLWIKFPPLQTKK